jgi:DNA-binding NarL/FixJ family response regulator
MTRARILLADDHVVMLEGLRSLLERHYDVVGTVTDGQALVQAVQREAPDVVVTDVSMPGGDGLEAARRILELAPRTRVVLLTMNESPGLAAIALRMGVSGFVLKTDAATDLVAAIDAALLGHNHLSQTLVGGTVSQLTSGDRGGSSTELTPRQLEVLRLLGQGRTMKEAAATLGVSPRTVAFHKYRIMEVLGLRTNAELFQHAVAEGLTTG